MGQVGGAGREQVSRGSSGGLLRGYIRCCPATAQSWRRNGWGSRETKQNRGNCANRFAAVEVWSTAQQQQQIRRTCREEGSSGRRQCCFAA